MQQVGKPVRGRDFIGRKEEIKMLKNYIKMGQSVVLIAPRRFGKTSLLLETIRQLKLEGYYTAQIDVFSNPTLSMLSKEIVSEVLDNHKLKSVFIKNAKSALDMFRQVKLKSVIDDFEFILDFSADKVNDWELFSNAIDFIESFSQKHKKKMVCAMDEFGDIEKFDKNESIIKLIRSSIQKQEQSTYIFSGSYESVMQAMFVNAKSPFYRLARIIRLSYLDPITVVVYIQKKLKSFDIHMSRASVEDVVDLTKGHPYYSQLAVQQIAMYYLNHGVIPSSDQLLSEMLTVDKDYLENIWSNLSSNKEFIFLLRHLPANPFGIYGKAQKAGINASRALNKLEGMGIIFKKDKGYYFYDPIFELWLVRNIN